MNLIVYPSSRNIRHQQDIYRKSNGIIPMLMTMSDFEKKASIIGLPKVDAMKRILFLRKGTDFEDFKSLKMDEMELISFFTKSEAIFKFLEEVAGEGIPLEDLKKADPYAEYEKHINTLKTLKENYRKTLLENGLTDKMFVYGDEIKINRSFVDRFSEIEVVVEGYLTKYELSFLREVGKHCKLILSVRTSTHSGKIQDGIRTLIGEKSELAENSNIKVSVGKKEIIETTPLEKEVNAKVHSVKERSEQVALAFAEIDKMISNGISPEDIALVLPDEEFKAQFMIFDHYRNLNFAMGKDYSKTLEAKKILSVYEFWQTGDTEKIEKFKIPMNAISGVGIKIGNVEEFFALLDVLGFEQIKEVEDASFGFKKIFDKYEFTYKEWMFLWGKAISKITLDDVGGGRVTALGVLETRGMKYKGVVIVDFNEENVPAVSQKDIFLSTEVRLFSGMPTKQDRESLQKHYYKRLIEDAEEVVIIYSTNDNALPSRFIYELGLEKGDLVETETKLLFPQEPRFKDNIEPGEIDFDASKIVWSPSRLKTYLDCKRKYYNRYILGARAEEEVEPNEGRIVHSFMEKVFAEKKSFGSEKDLKKEISIAMDSTIGKGTPKNEYRKMLWLKKMEGTIQSQIAHFTEGWIVDETEFDLAGTIAGVKFAGRVDRRDRREDDLFIIDYKTGSISDAQKTGDLEGMTDFQMSIYEILQRQKSPHVNLGFLQVFGGGDIEEITEPDKKQELLLNNIKELKQEKKLRPEKTEDFKKCRFCEFQLICKRGEYL